jgi:hypothetical protein
MNEPDSSKQNPCPWCRGHAYANAFIGDGFASENPGKWPVHIVSDDGSSIIECHVWCAECGARGPSFDTGLVSHIDEAQPQIEQAINAWNSVAPAGPHSGVGDNVIRFRK